MASSGMNCVLQIVTKSCSSVPQYFKDNQQFTNLPPYFLFTTTCCLSQDMRSTLECLLQETHLQREHMKGKQMAVEKVRDEIIGQQQKIDRAMLQVWLDGAASFLHKN